MTDVKAYRPDGGNISEGRLREIADNPYGDEEKIWLAKTVLSRAYLKPVGYVDSCNLRRMQRGEIDSAAIFLSPESTPVFTDVPINLVNAELALLRRHCDELEDALHTALPFVEDHEESDVYKPGAVPAALKKIRNVIAKSGEN
ncbi:hypothetical protein J7S78_13340 [Klebsiella oxytoca]|uniref:Uncharacterized protein n=1 Tax=Klebsiella oxytoca TaxID=571 RepID=A0AAP2FJK6_KLEOX|nr:hypothetical protein [Klebsiella oxytoca]MBQ0600775.1 hypothetical protein [Klebsiella oxytoca]